MNGFSRLLRVPDGSLVVRRTREQLEIRARGWSAASGPRRAPEAAPPAGRRSPVRGAQRLLRSNPEKKERTTAPHLHRPQAREGSTEPAGNADWVGIVAAACSGFCRP